MTESILFLIIGLALAVYIFWVLRSLAKDIKGMFSEFLDDVKKKLEEE